MKYDRSLDTELQCFPCPNYAICGTTIVAPSSFFDQEEVCYECANALCSTPPGRCNDKTIRVINEDHECPVCLQDVHQSARIPWCTHKLCIGCFRRIIMGWPPPPGPETGFPTFPLVPELGLIWDEYIVETDDRELVGDDIPGELEAHRTCLQWYCYYYDNALNDYVTGKWSVAASLVHRCPLCRQ